MSSERVSSELRQWLRAEMDRRGLSQNEAARAAGVGQATISEVLTKGSVPKVLIRTAVAAPQLQLLAGKPLFISSRGRKQEVVS